MGFADKDFRAPLYAAETLERHMAAGRLGTDLRWRFRSHAWERSSASLATPLKGAYRMELDKRGDDRGFFARIFCEKELEAAGLETLTCP